MSGSRCVGFGVGRDVIAWSVPSVDSDSNGCVPVASS